MLTLKEILLKSYSLDTSLLEASKNPLLNTLFLTKNINQIKTSNKENIQFNQLLTNVRITLLQHNYKRNVLVKGYNLTNKGLTSSDSASSSTNHANLVLQSEVWKDLYMQIGWVLKDLLVNYAGFVRNGKGFTQLFGDSLNKEYIKNKNDVFVKLDHVLYSTGFRIMIPTNKKELMMRIFKEIDSDKIKNVKKLRLFNKLSGDIIKNHNNCKYREILTSLVKEGEFNGDNLDKKLNKKEIFKFVTVILEKVFPIECFGNKTNKSIIFSNLSKLLFGEKGFGLNIVDCLKDIKIKEIRWLGPNVNLNKQDHLKRIELFKSFLLWLFNEYFPNLLENHFHITHISSSKELIFFHNKSWKEITKPFIQDYIDGFLLKRDIISVSQIELNSIYSKFRIMPKPLNDFRIINVPQKGKLTENKEYFKTIMNEIKPAKRILNHLRLRQVSNFPKLASVNQIPSKLFNFKQNLINLNNGRLPDLFFLKFDVKQCYDNIPQDMIFKCLDELIVDDQIYYYTNQQQYELSSCQLKYKTIVSNIDTIKQSEYLKNKNILIDSTSKTIGLTGREIRSICESQINNSFTIINKDDYYSRKKGIFQGLHLSSIFCDLVLDKLINEEFSNLNNKENTILRIADDFLIVSINQFEIYEINKKISSSFLKYGLEINEQKTFINFKTSQIDSNEIVDDFEDVLFCGLNINLKDLSIYKQFTPISLITSSHSNLLKRLISIFKLRLSYNNLNTSLNSIIYKLNHIESLSTSLAISYLNNNHFKINLNEFKWFIKELIKLMKYYDCFKLLKLMILKQFIEILKDKIRYGNCLAYLIIEYNDCSTEINMN